MCCRKFSYADSLYWTSSYITLAIPISLLCKNYYDKCTHTLICAKSCSWKRGFSFIWGVADSWIAKVYCIWFHISKFISKNESSKSKRIFYYICFWNNWKNLFPSMQNIRYHPLHLYLKVFPWFQRETKLLLILLLHHLTQLENLSMIFQFVISQNHNIPQQYSRRFAKSLAKIGGLGLVLMPTGVVFKGVRLCLRIQLLHLQKKLIYLVHPSLIDC